MTATVSARPDRISVAIDGKLGYDIWPTLRDARNAAQAARVPLSLDINRCDHIDMAGVGAILLAQEKLSCVELSGCPSRFVEYLRAFGICRHCAAANAPVPDCPKAQH